MSDVMRWADRILWFVYSWNSLWELFRLLNLLIEKKMTRDCAVALFLGAVRSPSEVSSSPVMGLVLSCRLSAPQVCGYMWPAMITSCLTPWRDDDDCDDGDGDAFKPSKLSSADQVLSLVCSVSAVRLMNGAPCLWRHSSQLQLPCRSAVQGSCFHSLKTFLCMDLWFCFLSLPFYSIFVLVISWNE